MDTLQDLMLELQQQLVAICMDYWKEYVFNTWQWWLNIATLILPVIVWWILVDKKRLMGILVFGFFSSGFAVFFDLIGETLVLWDYPFLIIPMDYLLIDTDYAILPVAYMLAYQYYPRWKSFILANTVISAIFSFLAEPLLVLIRFYELHEWKYMYSFPVYIVIAVICKSITGFFLKKQSMAIDSELPGGNLV